MISWRLARRARAVGIFVRGNLMEIEPLPVEPIGYYVEVDQTLRRLIRTICVLGLIIGGMGLVLIPVSLISFQRVTPYTSWWTLVNFAMYAAIEILLIIGS